MAPFHPLRHDAREFTARAGAAFAVFLTIAFVLLAGGAEQQLASAEANKGDTGAGEAAVLGQTDAPNADAPATEPVLGAEPPPEPAAAEGAAPEEHAEEPPAEKPVEEPTPESKADAGAPPLSDEDGFDGKGDWGGDDKGHGDDAYGDGDAHDGDDDGHDGDDDAHDGDGHNGDGDARDGEDHQNGWGGDDRKDDHENDQGWRGGDDESGGDNERGWGDDRPGDERARGNERGWVGRPGGSDDGGDGEWGGADRREGIAPPSGGEKGDEPGYRGGDEGDWTDEPAPSGRPQVTPPAGQEPTSNPAAVVAPPSVQDTPPGSGTGNVRDTAGQPGDSSSSNPQTRRFRTAATRASQTGADTGGGTGGTAAGDAPGEDAAGTGATGAEPSGDADGGGQGAGGGAGGQDGDEEGSSSTDREEGGSNPVTRVVRDFVEVVPDSIKAALAALAALSVLLGTGYLFAALRARRLARQRRELLQEVGLLQTALLPPVPDKVGALLTSVAYRPADGPGAGGDFYDVLPLPGGRVGFILGDVSGHGRGALARTAFMRYTLRAYLEAGLEPRVALQVAGRVIDENLGGDFATVLLAVHDPETGSLTYATAGHPAPIVVGPQPHEPVTAGSSPPIGVGVRTGLRQTTVPLVSGSVAALFTDGLMEARTEDGILGRERLAELLEEIRDDPSARGLIERVAAEAALLSDDMAAVVVTPTAGVTAGLFRTEQLELSARELDGPIARRFLEACGLPLEEVDEAERDARQLADRFGGVVLHVVFGNRLSVEVLPRNVESIEAASRRVSAGTAQ